MKTRTKLITTGMHLSAFAAAMLLAGSASAASLGMNWVNNGNGGVQDGNGDSLASTDVAGAPGFAQSNWNNLGRWGDNVNLVDSDGAFSGVLVAWDATGVWNNGASTATGDGKMMNGYLDSNGGVNTTLANTIYGNDPNNKPLVYFSGISAFLSAQGACSYDVVVYASGDASGRVGQYWLVAGTGSANSGGNNFTWGNNLTTPVFMSPTPFNGTYTQVPLTSTAGGTAAVGNYVVFTNLTADSFLLRTEEYNFRAPINGVQIWPHLAGAPVIGSTATTQTNYGGQTIQLALSVASCTTPAFQWQAGAIGSGVYTNVLNGGNISGATSPALTISNATLANSADYILIASNAIGAATSEIATVVVVPAIITGPTPATEVLYPGATAHFLATVQATSPTFSWRKAGLPLSDGGRVSGSTTNLLSISNVAAGDDVAYDLVVTTPYGEVTSSSAALSLLAPPPAGSFAESVITNDALAYWRFNETTGPTAFDYAGGFNGTYASAATLGVSGPLPPDYLGFASDNLAFEPTAADQTWVTIPALNLRTNTVTFVAWLNLAEDQADWAAILTCRHGSTQAGFNFSNTKNELVYTWNGNTTYQYHTGLIVPNNIWTMVALVISPTNATFYACDTNSSIRTAVIVLNNNSELFDGSAAIGEDDGFGTSRTMHGSIDEVAVFKHSLTPAQITALWAAGRGAGVLAPTISQSPLPQSLYPGRTAQFTVTVSGTEPLTYQWRKAGAPLQNVGNVSGATTPILSLTGVAQGDAAAYDVVVTNSAGSVTSSVAALTIIAPTGAAYEAAVLAAEPYAYWRLNEASGSAYAFDAYGGYTATYGTAAAAGVPGPVNADFTGFESANSAVVLYANTPGSWVSVPPLNLNTNTVTVTAWIYPNSPNQTNSAIFYQRQGLTVAGLRLDGVDGTRLAYDWNNSGGAYNFLSGLTIVPYQWSFVALVVEPDKATLYLYTNRTQFAAANLLAHPNQDFSGTSYIGNDTYDATGARIFNGTVDEVAVWNRALTGEQIAGLYTAASGAHFAPTVDVQPQPQSVYAGMNAQFTVSAAGSATLQYHWLKNGAPITDGGSLSGATTPALNITAASSADNSTYSVVVTNSFGSITSQVATLTVLPTSARVVWSAPAPITTADATLNQSGNVVGAEVFGNVETLVTLTSGAVLDFKTDGSVATTTGNGTANLAFDPNTTGNVNFDAVLNEFNYDGGPKTITVKGLIPGHQYSVQLFALDDRAGPPDNVVMSRRAYFQDGYDTNNVSAMFYMSNNVYVVATFTAAGTTATLREVLPGLDDGTAQVGNGNINALVLRDMTSAPTIASQPAPASLTRYVGSAVTFTASTFGTPPMTYQWQKGTGGVFVNDGAPGTISFPVITPVSLTIPSVSAGDTADYRLVVANSSGSVTSQVATLTVLTPAAGSYTAAVLSYGPIGYWRLNEASGSLVASDYVAGNDAANTNVILGVPGPTGAALEPGNTAAAYNGTNSATSTSVSLLNNRSQFTLVGWFNMAGAPEARTGLFGQNDAVEFGFHNTNSIGIWSPNGGYVEFPIASLVYGQWYQVAAVADGTSYHLYLNGVLQVTGGDATSNYGSSSYPFRIGGDGILDTTGNFFNGSLDEVAVYGHALTADQILSLYQGASPVSLDIQLMGGSVQVTWPKGTLLEADSLSGPWTTNNAATPYTVPPTGAKKFYRVIVQ